MELNKTLLEIIEEVSRRAHFQIITDEEQFQANFMLAMMLRPAIAECNGCFYSNVDKSVDELYIRTDKCRGLALKVIFHELGHATGIKLHRKMFVRPETIAYAREEVIAEYTAYHCLRYFELDTIEMRNSASKYIEYFAANLSLNDIHECQEKSKEAFKYIISNWLPDFNERFILNHKKAV